MLKDIEIWTLTHQGIDGNAEIFAYGCYCKHRLIALFKVKGTEYCYDIPKNI